MYHLGCFGWCLRGNADHISYVVLIKYNLTHIILTLPLSNIPDKRETHTVTFSVQFTFIGSSNLINTIVTTGRFVTELQYGIKEYPYLFLA